MKVRNRFVPSLIAICLIASPVVYAARTSVNSPAHAVFITKPKIIKFNLRNDLGTSIELKAGEDLFTLEPGAVKSLSLPVGTRITRVTATGNHPADELIAEVTSSLSDVTIAIKS